MGEQGRHRHVTQNIAGGAAEGVLANPRVAVGTHDDEVTSLVRDRIEYGIGDRDVGDRDVLDIDLRGRPETS